MSIPLPIKKKKSGAYYRKLKKYGDLWSDCGATAISKQHKTVPVYRCNATLG